MRDWDLSILKGAAVAALGMLLLSGLMFQVGFQEPEELAIAGAYSSDHYEALVTLVRVEARKGVVVRVLGEPAGSWEEGGAEFLEWRLPSRACTSWYWWGCVRVRRRCQEQTDTVKAKFRGGRLVAMQLLGRWIMTQQERQALEE